MQKRIRLIHSIIWISLDFAWNREWNRTEFYRQTFNGRLNNLLAIRHFGYVINLQCNEHFSHINN